jgi:hypothetical protein
MMDFLHSIEQIGFVAWVREGGAWYGYAFILFMHTMGLALVVGGNAVIDLRLLGFAPQMPIRPLEKLFGFIWVGFYVNLISGIILLMADASVKLRNPLFGIKMLLVVGGIVVLKKLRRGVFGSPLLDKGELPPNARGLAWASLFFWLAALTAGRLLAYLGPVAGLA